MGVTDTELFWWNIHKEEALQRLTSKENGLSSDEVKSRLKTYGENTISKGNKNNALSILLSQFKNWLTLILVFASIVSFLRGEHIDSVVIILLVILSSFFGFVQEYKAEKTLLKLKKLIKHKASVYRDGRIVQVDSTQIVPGDIVELVIGDIVPADIRLIGSEELLLNESVLTGESMPVEKDHEVVIEKDVMISDMKNMLFMGTSVFQGNGIGVVTATGVKTQFGKIAESVKSPETKTEFQSQIDNFSKFLFKVIVLMTVFIFVSNVALDKGVSDSFLFAIALAVGIAPEMLPAIITVTLSQGAMRMAKKKVVVKRLSSVEDFGNIDTLCMDKTGTITKGIFSLHDYIGAGDTRDDQLLIYALICTSGISQQSEGGSNPTDIAIWQSSLSQKFRKKVKRYKILDENEFDYDRKRMSVLAKMDEGNLLISKGAPEAILNVTKYVQIGDKLRAKSQKLTADILDNVKKYETEGYRVIAVASKTINNKDASPDDEKNMVFMGLLLFKDPIKETTVSAIKRFLDLGINLKVISGDSEMVTKSISREAGIVFNDDQVVTGEMLKDVNDADFMEYSRSGVVFARLTPDQKYRIIRSLNYEGHIVGFLGDGVNDVSALKEADVGITVEGGSDIAKEASDIILLEKDLKVLVDGIEAGRKTYGNVMKYILNTISANYGNMFTVAISSLFLKFIPLLPSQILLNNFISDIPLFAVATDNVDSGFMKKPNKWNLGYIKNFMITYGFVSTFFDMLLILPMVYVFKVNTEVFRTAWFVESSISEMLVTFVIRTKLPFYKSRPSNWLLGLSGISIVIVILMSVLEIGVFGFVQLPYFVWSLILFDLIAYFVVTEIVKKRFFRRFESGK